MLAPLRLAARGARLLQVQAVQARTFATAAPPSTSAKEKVEEDFVQQVFREQQEKLRALMDGMKSITVPVDGDAAAVSKFQTAYEALRKKVGLPSIDEKLDMELEMLREASPDVRSFLTGAALLRQQACVPDAAGMDAALLEELTKLEVGGKPLLFSDAKGMAAFSAATAPLLDKAGLKGASEAELVAASAAEEAENMVFSIKSARDEAIAAAKVKSGLTYL